VNRRAVADMKYTQTIVCFAKSRKAAGHCIAGKQWRNGRPGDWVRPVSVRPTREISEQERRYQDGRAVKLLDIVAVPCDNRQPLPHQRENHTIDPSYYWVKRGRLAWNDVCRWLDSPEALWSAGQNSYAFLNNRVVLAPEGGTSLYLIAVERLRILVGERAPEYSDSKRIVRGEFIYNHVTYRLAVTDLSVERHYLSQPDGQYVIVRPVLCISLGDPYEGYYYKLIAAVFYPERFT
jgi:hypothetical protein